MTRTERLDTALRSAAPDLLAYLVRRVGPDDAGDLLGDAMLIAWRRVADLPADPERARMWLFGIARGTVLNFARGERRRGALAHRIREHLGTAATAPAADDGAEVRDAIARLDPDLAELVRLVHWERLTIGQAGEVMGVPASTARGRYQRARDLLYEALLLSEATDAVARP